MAKVLNCNSTTNPNRSCRAKKTIAWRTLTWPLGIGRAAVRATRASKFRSTISLTVHPAPRMTSDPMTNKTSIFPSGHEGDAREMLHQQGSNNNQVPMGRSARAKRR